MNIDQSCRTAILALSTVLKREANRTARADGQTDPAYIAGRMDVLAVVSNTLARAMDVPNDPSLLDIEEEVNRNLGQYDEDANLPT